jgi:paraquat-inducible protein B
MKGSLLVLHQTLKDTDKLVVNLDSRVGPLVTDLRSTLESARGTLANIEKAFSMEEGVPAQLGETMKKADTALQQAEMTLATIQITAKDASNVGYELNKTLRELSGAARSIRFLADYIERHPEAFLRGKPDSGGE